MNPRSRKASNPVSADSFFEQYELISKSGYFDAAYYSSRYQDVAQSGADPLSHYVETGAAEGRDPHPDFDTAYYLAQCAKKERLRVRNPLVHFLLQGRRIGLQPNGAAKVKQFASPAKQLSKPRALSGALVKAASGDGFAVLTGWIAEKDSKAAVKGPLSIGVAGQDFGPVQLERHKSLADAGIAGGQGFFAVALPVVSVALGKPLEATITDADGRSLKVVCPAASVVHFRPVGAIEQVGPEGIRGWIFDPRLGLRRQKPILRVDDEFDELVEVSGLRDGIPIQNLVSAAQPAGKVYGFRSDIGRLIEKLRARQEKDHLTVRLISSGEVVWTQLVPLRGGQAMGFPGEEPPDPVDGTAALQPPSAKASVPKPTTAYHVPLVARQAAADAPKQRPTMLVVSWDMGHNPVGRAYLLADMARAHFDVKLIGPQFREYGNGLWGPLKDQAALQIEIFNGGSLREYLSTVLQLVERAAADVVYVSKPRLPSLLFGLLMHLRHGSALVVDSDDHELSFFKSSTPLSISQALAAAKADPEGSRMPFSEVWTRLGEHLMQHAGAITVSNAALQKKFGGTIVRHARDEKTFMVSAERRALVRREFGLQDDQIAILFLGTPRPHKGIYQMAEALDRINDKRLVFVIVGSITDARTRNQLAQFKRANIKYFEDQPWSRIQEIVAMADIVPVLQVHESRIADFQIPAKLTDAIALDVPVVATRVAPLADLAESGALVWIDSDADLERVLRARLKSAKALQAAARKGKALYERDFTYAINAARIKSAADEARSKEPAAELMGALKALYDYAGVPLAFGNQAVAGVSRTVSVKPEGKRDLVFFWKQNDSDLYGRRSDMMVKYLLESGKFRKILQLDRAITLQEMQAVVDRGAYASNHEGNLVYLNTTRRLLKMADTRTLARRTFLCSSGDQPQTFLGEELPPREAYADFVRATLAECGMDPNPVAWVCPVVFDFPGLHSAIGFEQIIVDIIDDQRKWKVQEAYLRRLEQNYVEVLELGDLILCNCEPVREGFRELRNDIIVVPNGAEVFPDNRQWSLPEDLAGIPKPIIGYVGNLRDRVDVGLIRELAERRPNWSVVLIGSAGGSLDVLSLQNLPNVHLLGVRPYGQALSYIKHFDVAIMPHLNNAISENMNPLKLYVYFALNVPIVTTKVSNIDDIGPYVSVAKSAKEFIAAVEACLKGKGPKMNPRTRRAILDKVSWKRRVDQVISKLKL